MLRCREGGCDLDSGGVGVEHLLGDQQVFVRHHVDHLHQTQQVPPLLAENRRSERTGLQLPTADRFGSLGEHVCSTGYEPFEREKEREPDLATRFHIGPPRKERSNGRS